MIQSAEGGVLMECRLDLNRTYAIALEGGGARGGYQIGVWKALDEAGVRYNAVSGTSVGALNGAMMVMRDLPRAIDAWSNIRLSKVIDLDEAAEKEMKKLMDGGFDPENWQNLISGALELIRGRGLDVAPLRAWVREVVDARRIKASDVDFYICTLSLSDRRALEVHVNELPEDQICDMLLASAYHPSFRLERLGGKYYVDGSLVDNLPLHPLVEAGYRDIIAVRIHGTGVERRFKMPEDVRVTTIEARSDLGRTLNFDAEQARRNMELGYLDAKRVLYGLYGRLSCVERTMSERESLEWLLDRFGGAAESLRACLERELPAAAKRLGAEDGGYYELMLLLAEEEAQKQGVDLRRVLSDRELLQTLE